jgi:hypothetical protein
MKKAIIAKIGEYNQLSVRISSLDQNQARVEYHKGKKYL